MNQPDDHQLGRPHPGAPDTGSLPDDTVEASLADDLLGSGPTQLLGEPPISPPVAQTTGDEDDYLAPEGPRSRWTIGLAFALIFVIGALCGVVLSKTLSPEPPAQVIYILNDGSGASARPFPPGGMPSGGPTGSPR